MPYLDSRLRQASWLVQVAVARGSVPCMSKQRNCLCLPEFVRIVFHLVIHNSIAHPEISGTIVYRAVKTQPVEMSHRH